MLSLSIILISLLVAEAITSVLRFGFKKDSEDYHVGKMKKKWKKFRFHWHHFLTGLVVIPLSLLFSGLLEKSLFNIGIGIFLSDFVHHFFILLIFTGKTDFHLLYRNKDLYEEKVEIQTRRKKVLKKLTKVV